MELFHCSLLIVRKQNLKSMVSEISSEELKLKFETSKAKVEAKVAQLETERIEMQTKRLKIESQSQKMKREVASLNSGRVASIRRPCNMRSLPTTQGKVMKQYGKGEKVYVVPYDASWNKIVVNDNDVAFMSRKCF